MHLETGEKKLEQQQLHNFKVVFNNDFSPSSPPQSFKHQIKTMGSVAVFQRNNLPKGPYKISSRQETPYTAFFLRSNRNNTRLVFLLAPSPSVLNGVCGLCYNVQGNEFQARAATKSLFFYRGF